ncbi:MAG: hypothetical protein J5656_04980 [Clostridia bacterium]|nr:hypothetical protein [Clostridia bacterium]
MTKKRSIEFSIELLFIVTGVILYILFLLEDFGDYYLGDNVWLKYSIIIILFVYSLIAIGFGTNPKEFKDNILLALALLFTLLSDYFLLVQDDNYEVGVIMFTFAQLFHALRIERNKIHTIISVIIRIILPVVGIIVLASMGELNVLYAFVLIYATQLLMNFVENLVLCFISKTNKIKYILLTIGFALFIGCDVCVGLMNIGEYSAALLMWAFYAPSQALIALSTNK